MARKKKPTNQQPRKPKNGTVVLAYDRMPKTLQKHVDRIIKIRKDRDLTAAVSGSTVSIVAIPHAGVRGLIPVATTLAGAEVFGGWMVHDASMKMGESLRNEHKPHANMIARWGTNMVYVNEKGDLAATDYVPIIGGYSRIVIDPSKLTDREKKRLKRRWSLPKE